MKIRKGDKVKVIKGKDAGKEGNVLQVLPAKHAVVVEGANVSKRHAKQVGIVDVVKPLNVAKVRLICAKCNAPTRVGYKVNKEGDKIVKVRYCKKCDSEI